MEPRPHERGKRAKPQAGQTMRAALQWSHVLTNVERRLETSSSEQPLKGFNGATSSRTWKEGAFTVPFYHSPGFNGATSSRTWKANAILRDLQHVSRLQWSHVLTNVESG